MISQLELDPEFFYWKYMKGGMWMLYGPPDFPGMDWGFYVLFAA